MTVGPGAFTGFGLGSLRHNLWHWRRVNPLSAPPRSKPYWLRKAKPRRPSSSRLIRSARIFTSNCLPRTGSFDSTTRSGSGSDLNRGIIEWDFGGWRRGGSCLACFAWIGITANELTGPKLPDARWLARIVTHRVGAGNPVPVAPLYLRPPDVGPPSKRRSDVHSRPRFGIGRT